MEIDKSFVDAMRNERGEGARGTRVSKPSTCRHVVVDSTDKEEKGSTSLGMIRHWPRHSLLSSKPRWRILSYFFFTFRFLPERERRKKERKKEKSLEQAYETAPTDPQSALNFHQVVNTSERKNSSFRQKKFQKIEYFFRYELLPLHHPGKEERKISSSKRILNISKKRETVFLRNLQMEKIGQRVTKREKDHVLS